MNQAQIAQYNANHFGFRYTMTVEGSMFTGYTVIFSEGAKDGRSVTFHGDTSTAILDQIEAAFGTRPAHFGDHQYGCSEDIGK